MCYYSYTLLSKSGEMSNLGSGRGGRGPFHMTIHSRICAPRRLRPSSQSRISSVVNVDSDADGGTHDELTRYLPFALHVQPWLRVHPYFGAASLTIVKEQETS